MSDWPRANASNSPTLAFQPTIAMKTKNSVPKSSAACRERVRHRGQRRVPVTLEQRRAGVGVQLRRVHGHDREDDRDQHRDAEEQQHRVVGDPLAPALPLAPSPSGSSVSNMEPASRDRLLLAGVQQAAHLRDVHAHAGALVAQLQRVPHLLHAGRAGERERADDDREPRRREGLVRDAGSRSANMPASVSPRSPRLPTIAPTIAEPITSTPTRNASSALDQVVDHLDDGEHHARSRSGPTMADTCHGMPGELLQRLRARRRCAPARCRPGSRRRRRTT